MSFRLISANFQDRYIPLSLIEGNQLRKNRNSFTIIIGKNGVGKSRLLAEICRAFDSFDADGRMKKSKINHKKYGKTNQFEISYAIDDKDIKVYFEGTRASRIEVSGHFIENIADLPLPARVIATTITPFDKFPISRNHERFSGRNGTADNSSLIYRYIGSKNNVGQISSTGQLSRVVEALIFASSKERSELARLSQVFEFLGYQPIIAVDYKFRISISRVREFHESFQEGNLSANNAFIDRLHPHSIRFGAHKIRDDMNANPNFQNELFEALDSVLKISIERDLISIAVDFDKGKFSSGSIQTFKKISFLRKYGILGIDDLRLSSKNSDVVDISIRDASSGEQSIVLTILGIASEIKDNSMVIIDEPEISLHPEWQEKFISLIYSTFENYSGCHFLMATHSPQLVAHAGENSCAVVAIDDQNISINDADEYLKKSADFQLAEVFETPGYRNEYLAREGLAAMRLASRRQFDSSDFKERIDILQRARPHLKQEDPVAQMTDALITALEEYKSDQK